MACSDIFSSGIFVTKGIEMHETAQMSILNIEKPNAADSRDARVPLQKNVRKTETITEHNRHR